jgi:AAA+ ATPase superfamily predicted ATPase
VFIGRKEELKKLNGMWSLSKSSLVVCRGRRRIGKSRLIKEFSKTAKQFFFHQGLPPRQGQTDFDQLNHFYKSLAAFSDVRKPENPSWETAFTDLSKAIGDKNKTLIFIDEISWVGQHDGDFAGYLKNAWDEHFSLKKNALMVLCGSVSTWIESNILSSTAFVGRVSKVINLGELSLPEAVELLHLENDHEKMRCLCLVGGVPKYLEEFNPQLSLRENTQQLFFSKDGYLFNDYERIFNDIFLKKSETYKAIVETLIDKRKNLSEIAKSLKLGRGGQLSQYLHDLVLSGFLCEDYNFELGGKKRKTSYFRISDNYLRFYLKYVEPKKIQINQGWAPNGGIESLPGSEAILGLQFESLIFNNRQLLFSKLGIDPSSVKSCSSYVQKKTTRNKGGCQIDLLIELNGYELILCEIKFKTKIGSSVIKEIAEKNRLLKRPKHYSVKTALIYFGELTSTDEMESKINHLISIEDLVLN